MNNYTVKIEKGRGTVTLPTHLLPVGIHTMEVVYNQSEHYNTCKTGKHALLVHNYNKNYYNTHGWSGTPVIDKNNEKITINRSNITYLNNIQLFWKDIIYYNQYWKGNPVIDKSNEKVTINKSNITYINIFDTPTITNIYNTKYIVGNPVIDEQNKKITINKSNITYIQQVEG